MTSGVADAMELEGGSRGAVLEGDAGDGETILILDAEAGRAAPVEVAEMG